MNILFTVDRGYMEHLQDCIQAIIRFETEEGYDIYIMHSDLEEDDKMLLCGMIPAEKAKLHFISVDIGKWIDFPESGRYPLQIYFRIFAPAFLPDNLERILYLDADTIVINPLDELYHKEFGDNYILACTHIRKVLNKINQIRLGVREERPYINSGVMLLNLPELRKYQNYSQVAEYVEKYKRVLALPDQDIIMALYGDKIGLLDTMKYNLSDRVLAIYNVESGHEKRDTDWVRENAFVIHYCGRQKPWRKPYVGMLDIFYEELKAEMSTLTLK